MPDGRIIEVATDDPATAAAAAKKFLAGGAPKEIAEAGTVPAGVRAAVGAAATPQDRLATLQKFYPNAAVTPTDGDNFDISDPAAGRLVYNPSGLDVGDIASLGPEAAQLVGGTIGAALGSPAGLVGGVAGAGLGAAAGNEMFSRFAQRAMGTEDTRALGQQVTDAATTAALNSGGQAAGAVLGAAPKALVRGILRGGRKGAEQFAQAVADADKWGIPISVGEAADNAWKLVDSLPTKTAKTLKENTTKAASAALTRLTTRISGGANLSRSSVGTAVDEGVKTYGKTMRAAGRALDQEFFNLVPKDSSIPMQNTLAAIQRVLPDMPSMPATAAAESASPLGQRMQRLAADIAGGGGQLQLGDVRTLRRSVGEMIDSGALVEDIPLIKLKDLHGALTADLKGAADAAGPAAQQAWSRAQAFWKKELALMEDVLTPLVNKRVPSEISKALEGKMKDAPEYIDGVMKTLSPKQKDLIRAATLRKLGTPSKSGQNAAGDAWSFDKFLADWNGIDRAARNRLFRDREYASDLDALARTAERLHTRNLAGQAPTPENAVTSGMRGFFMLPVSFALTAIGAQGGQRLMRNRAFVHWLAKSTETSANGIGAHIGRLAGIAANSDPQTKEDISTFLEGLSE